ncbi:MAG: hypothetical protein A2428_08420 [Bdellovibrionales bacterium RIFOXYC1_FULL_54_43]|nr:MAG: hypothetical protein A2428_08420 [Bdellovibrionales bacterium RIFOXYC1_FULL_54_43]OFZ80363.1 MAG: hypothetical protein A2603_13345 [Bdellovibrionales bacterium RIFOXYD1_FULL_55_31]
MRTLIFMLSICLGIGASLSALAAKGGSKPDNFGKIVSNEAKVFRTEPVPGYRNFGQWVSSQRRHQPNRTRNGPTKVPTGSPVIPTAPVPPIEQPTGFSPGGSNGT